MPNPFVYRTDPNQYADSIGRLLLQRGEIEANRSTQVANAQARAAQVSGEAWGGAVRDIGGIAANTIGAVVKQNEERKVKQTLKAQDQAFMHAWGPNGEPPAPNIVMGIYGPERGADIAKGLSAIAELHTGQIKDARDTAGRLAIGVKALSPEAQAQFWPSIRASAIRGGLGDEKSIPEQATPEYLDAVIGWASGKAPEQAKAPEPFTLNPGDVRFDANGKQVATNPKPVEAPKAPTLGSFEDYVTRKYGANPTPEQITDARKVYQQADDRPININTGGNSDDAEAVADAIIRGEQPPELTSLYRDTVKVKAILGRKGYNQSEAITDWKATQKHLATANGAQQLRLNQSISALPELLDSVDALASKWKGGRFPPLNRASLLAAKNGVFGPDVASVAVQLDSQIADVVADLGNVYMGGNSPTDHALELAGKSLKGDWSEKVLHDMVKLAKGNVTIRQNSIRNVGVQGASANNPYAPQQAPPATGKIRAKDPQGNIHEAPTGTALPKDWVLQ